jgi:hypothetical protein
MCYKSSLYVRIGDMLTSRPECHSSEFSAHFPLQTLGVSKLERRITVLHTVELQLHNSSQRALETGDCRSLDSTPDPTGV